MLETTIQIILLLPPVAYFAVKYYYNYWKRKGIPYVECKPWNLDWYNLSAFDYTAKIYRQLSGYKFGGCFARFSPKLVVRDPELIKCILIKDFEYFHDRGDVTYDENEPITMHMFSAPGALWRNLRSRLTSTFTSGKMKYMFGLVRECAAEVVEELDEQLQSEEIIDVKDLCMRYTIEVISSCAFGLKTNSIKNRDSTFKIMAHRIFDRSIAGRISLLTRSVLPRFKRVFKLRLLSKPVTEFFFKLTEDNVKYRKSNAIDRNDFLQLLIKIQDADEKDEKRNKKLEMTNELMTAQCFLFFVAGFDTSSTVLSFSLYELAANPQVQRNLRDEIDTYLARYGGEVTYEMMKSMPYLHRVVSETMRKYPVLATLIRVCQQKYRIPDTEVFIDKGTEVLIPLSGIHRDEQYFPNPDQFDPDRFKDGDVCSVNRYAYLPFGEGPRNCIGSRFGLMSVKLGLIYLLRNHVFELSSKTQVPFEFARFKVVTTINRGIFLKCGRM